MASTTERLAVVAARHAWTPSRLRANEGKVAIDYFSRGTDTMKILYDAKGRLVEAWLFTNNSRFVDASSHLDHRDADKVKTVLSWLTTRSK